MDKKTLRALKGSIKKWEKIIDGTGKDDLGYNCPLCVLFGKSNCYGCPTGSKSCRKTPYDQWFEHNLHEHAEKLDFKVYCPTCKKLAIKELNFLKGLLPDGIQG